MRKSPGGYTRLSMAACIFGFPRVLGHVYILSTMTEPLKLLLCYAYAWTNSAHEQRTLQQSPHTHSDVQSPQEDSEAHTSYAVTILGFANINVNIGMDIPHGVIFHSEGYTNL
jgi:hypothetical protein